MRCQFETVANRYKYYFGSINSPFQKTGVSEEGLFLITVNEYP